MGGAVSGGVDNDDLIDKLLIAKYIKTPAVERVFRSVDRGFYFLPEYRSQAYRDMAWKHKNLHLSAPCIYSEALEQLNIKPGLSFLNIGSGTGYLSTMVGLLLGPNGINHGVEIYADVVIYAYGKLEEFKQTSSGIDLFEFCEPQFVVGNGFCLDPDRKYDRIYCGAACPKEYHQHIKQYMKVGGILVLPCEDDLLKIIRHSETEWKISSVLQVSFSTLRLPQRNNSSDMINIATSPLCLQALCRSNIRSIIRTVAENENPSWRTYRRTRPNKKRKSDIEVISVFNDEETEPDSDDVPTRYNFVGLIFHRVRQQQRQQLQIQQQQSQQNVSRTESEERMENDNTDKGTQNESADQKNAGESSSQTDRLQCKSYLARYILNKTPSSSNSDTIASNHQSQMDSCRKRTMQKDWNQPVDDDDDDDDDDYDEPDISDESGSERSSSTAKHVENDQEGEGRKTPLTDKDVSKSVRNDCSPSKKVCREHELTPESNEDDGQETIDDNQPKISTKRGKLDSGISEESDGDGMVPEAATEERSSSLSSSSSSESTCSEPMDVESDFTDSDFIDGSYPPHQGCHLTRNNYSSSETGDGSDEENEVHETDNRKDNEEEDESSGAKDETNYDTLTVKYRTVMEEKIQTLPLPYAIKSYLNYNREFKFCH